jgi:(p)ppGpp synthase/HD superfamily hydrolase
MSRLDQAIKLAIEVHEGQVDKGGNPYILHPLRVMCAVEKDLRSGSGKHREDYLCAAVLHDVIEDYDAEDYTEEQILEKVYFGVGEQGATAIYCLTRNDRESWKNYIQRVYENPIARFVKIHDLEDNGDLSRLKKITKEDINRNSMYARALTYLETGEGKF